MTSIHAYLATALTSLAADERSHVDAVSDLAADVCHELNIMLYQPRGATDPVNNPDIPDEEVFRLDRHRVRRSDLLIYVADYPSTGAGLELVFAYEAMIPIIALGSTATRISRMVTGMPGPLFIVRYENLRQLRGRLQEQLREIVLSVIPRRATVESNNRNQLGERIRELRQKRGLSQEDLSRTLHETYFSLQQIREWEESSDLESNLSVVHLREIAAALNADIGELLS